MKTSELGIAFIANEEGWVPRVYDDKRGNLTVGYGHRVREHEHFPTTLTHEEGLRLLARDVRTAEDVVNARVRVPLNQNQFDALVSFAFNIGEGHFVEDPDPVKNCSVLSRINAGDYGERVETVQPDGSVVESFTGAAEAFEFWIKAYDQTLKRRVVDGRLVARRKRERDVFLKPV